MAAPVVNYLFSSSKWNIQEIKFYLQATKDIVKESEHFDITVSNDEDIIYHILSLANKYRWGRLAFMVETGAGANNIFRHLE